MTTQEEPLNFGDLTFDQIEEIEEQTDSIFFFDENLTEKSVCLSKIGITYEENGSKKSEKGMNIAFSSSKNSFIIYEHQVERLKDFLNKHF